MRKIEMESQKLEKKKKNRARLQRPRGSQAYKLDETLTEEDILFLCFLTNSMKSKEKDKKQKKKKVKREIKNRSQYSQKGQDPSLDSDFSSKSSSSRKMKPKRKRVSINPDNTCPARKLSDTSDDPFESPVMKNKEKKLSMSLKSQTSALSPSGFELHGRAPKNISDGKTHGSSNIEATTHPKLRSTPKDDEWTSQRGRIHSLHFHQINMYNSTSLFSTALPKAKRVIKLSSPGKAQDMEGISYHIAQKQFGLTQPCLMEEPLNLSLPSRIRAKRNILRPSSRVTKVESQSVLVKPWVSKNKKVRFSFTPSQKSKIATFIQTFLNPNYFFKKKGKPGKANAVTPLLKIKNQGKSCVGKKGIGAN